MLCQHIQGVKKWKIFHVDTFFSTYRCNFARKIEKTRWKHYVKIREINRAVAAFEAGDGKKHITYVSTKACYYVVYQKPRNFHLVKLLTPWIDNI